MLIIQIFIWINNSQYNSPTQVTCKILKRLSLRKLVDMTSLKKLLPNSINTFSVIKKSVPSSWKTSVTSPNYTPPWYSSWPISSVAKIITKAPTWLNSTRTWKSKWCTSMSPGIICTPPSSTSILMKCWFRKWSREYTHWQDRLWQSRNDEWF